MFDVIIVGAGPAGSSCARRVAELGLSTLVLEKTAFPRSKPCGSGLSARALAHLGADAARSGDLPADAYRSRLVREVLPHVNVIRTAGNLCYSAGPRALAFVVRAPALRSALMRVGPWGRLGPGGGRLVVETP